MLQTFDSYTAFSLHLTLAIGISEDILSSQSSIFSCIKIKSRMQPCWILNCQSQARCWYVFFRIPNQDQNCYHMQKGSKSSNLVQWTHSFSIPDVKYWLFQKGICWVSFRCHNYEKWNSNTQICNFTPQLLLCTCKFDGNRKLLAVLGSQWQHCANFRPQLNICELEDKDEQMQLRSSTEKILKSKNLTHISVAHFVAL